MKRLFKVTVEFHNSYKSEVLYVVANDYNDAEKKVLKEVEASVLESDQSPALNSFGDLILPEDVSFYVSNIEFLKNKIVI